MSSRFGSRGSGPKSVPSSSSMPQVSSPSLMPQSNELAQQILASAQTSDPAQLLNTLNQAVGPADTYAHHVNSPDLNPAQPLEVQETVLTQLVSLGNDAMQHIVHTAVNTATAPAGPMGGQQSVSAPSINVPSTSPSVQTSPSGPGVSGQGVTAPQIAGPFTLPSTPSTGGGGGGGGGGGEQLHKVYHDFNNHANQDISLTFTGSIKSVFAESKAAPDGLYSTGLDAKHYTVTFYKDVDTIHVTPGDITAGGRDDSGITVAKIEKIAPKRFKVWFNRAKGANTYVNEFGIEGI